MIVFILSTIFLIIVFYELYWKRRDFPPGPIPLSFVGNLMSLMREPPGYAPFNRWAKKYGDVYTFWIGSSPCIMINTFEKMKETFIKDGDTYAGKVEQEFQVKIRGGVYGIIETNGDMWREHRRFALMNMRDFGLGKDLMQAKILIEVEDLFRQFDSEIRDEIDLPEKFEVAVGSVINQVLFGYRFDDTRKEEFIYMKKLLDFQNEIWTHFRNVLQALIPRVGYVMPGTRLEIMLEDFRKDLFAFFEKQVEEHRNKIDYSAEDNTDFVEAYLKEQKRKEENGDIESFGKLQLFSVCLDMWFAGLMTTTATISWVFGYLLNIPGVQEKLHEELDRVVGSDRLITTSDKNELPYMNAFINESQRCANIVPINLFHMTTKDTEINGYPIKKGTGVIAQISTVMMDEKVFPEPETFNPDRFIENGKLKKIDEFVPFSVGKRSCLGEGLAKMELFLFIANFLNRYEVSPSSEGPPSLDKSKDSMVKQRDFKAILKKRV